MTKKDDGQKQRDTSGWEISINSMNPRKPDRSSFITPQNTNQTPSGNDGQPTKKE